MSHGRRSLYRLQPRRIHSLILTGAHHAEQVGAGLDDGPQGFLDGIEQDVLQEEVVDGVSGDAQLRVDADGDAARVKLAGRCQ